MGMDLTLVPSRYDHARTHWFLSYTRVGLARDYDIFHQIGGGNYADGGHPQVCQPKQLPSNIHFDWYEDEGMKRRTTDPYGSPLAYVTAEELGRVTLPDDASEWNKAAFAFIRALPPETWVVLWWH